MGDDRRRNFSNNTRGDNSMSDARSRGISGVSGDLNQTQVSHWSNDGRSTIADKVRGVHFANRAESPNDRKANFKTMNASDIEEDKDIKDQVADHDKANNLSPYQHLVANRRSLSYSRDARSPSWNEGQFNSSAMSSPSKDTAELRSPSFDGISEKDLSQLNLYNIEKPVYNLD